MDHFGHRRIMKIDSSTICCTQYVVVSFMHEEHKEKTKRRRGTRTRSGWGTDGTRATLIQKTDLVIFDPWRVSTTEEVWNVWCDERSEVVSWRLTYFFTECQNNIFIPCWIEWNEGIQNGDSLLVEESQTVYFSKFVYFFAKLNIEIDNVTHFAQTLLFTSSAV